MRPSDVILPDQLVVVDTLLTVLDLSRDRKRDSAEKQKHRRSEPHVSFRFSSPPGDTPREENNTITIK